MGEENASFGFQAVTVEEKRVLVGAQFDAIAATYDLAGALLTFGLHRWWKRTTVAMLRLQPGERVLDLCGGTADLSVLAAPKLAPDGRVVVCDFNRPMLQAGAAKIRRRRLGRAVAFVQGDAERLCFPDGTFTAVLVGFGVRNFARPGVGLAEAYRVLAPGGRLAILEFCLPPGPWLRRLYDAYSFRVLPRAGEIITGTRSPYVYLAESIRAFPPPAAFSRLLAGAGFAAVSWRLLTGGLACVYLARRAETCAAPPAAAPLPMLG